MSGLRQVVRVFLEFLLSKRLHIGALAFISSVFYMRLIGVQEVNYMIVVVSSLIVWAAYLENLCTDKKEDKLGGVPHGVYPDIESRFLALEKLYPLIYLAALGGALLINLRTFIVAIFAAAVFSSYVQPVFRRGQQRIRLKEIFLIKNIVPVLGWILSIFGIATVYYNQYFVSEYIVIFMVSFLGYFREEIKFDIPDAEGDKIAGIKTIPNSLGLSRTKSIIKTINYLGVGLLCLLLLWLALMRKTEIMLNLAKLITPMVFFFLLDDGFLYLLSETKRKEYCNLGILWWVFLLALFLWISYPINIVVFLSLKLGSSFAARRLKRRTKSRY